MTPDFTILEIHVDASNELVSVDIKRASMWRSISADIISASGLLALPLYLPVNYKGTFSVGKLNITDPAQIMVVLIAESARTPTENLIFKSLSDTLLNLVSLCLVSKYIFVYF
jgi:hypothetical protein